MPASDNQSSTWEEPPWSGFIETTGDALLILEAARRGLIPRVTRRLVDSERKMITSGSVFVFDEDESGIKRWTDGFYWSPSRILGNFLLYRETDKRGGNRGGKSDSNTLDAIDGMDGARAENSLSRSRMDDARMAVDKNIERNLLGSLTNSYKFKPDGLMKKTFSLAIGGVSQHLISYYKIEDVTNGRLRSPSSLPELASLDISPEYLDKTHFRNPPKVEVGIDGVPRYRGEADDIDTSANHLTGPLSTGLPLVTNQRPAEPAVARRIIAAPTNGTNRFEPYAGQPAASGTKRTRRPKASPDPPTPTTEHQQQQPPQKQATPSPTAPVATPSPFPEPNATAHPHQPPPPVPAAAPYPPYPGPPYYQAPGYPQVPPPHAYFPPPNIVMQHSPHIQPPPAGQYPVPSNAPSEQSSQASSSEAQPSYGYPYPPPPAGYPPHGYGSPWPPYGMYPPHAAPPHMQAPTAQIGTGAKAGQGNGHGNKSPS